MSLKFPLYGWLSLCFCLLTAVGCSDDDNVVVPPDGSKPQFELPESSADCPAEGGAFSFVFSISNATAAQASVSTESEWISDVKIAQQSRGVIDGKVDFTVQPNESTEPRRGSITLTYEQMNVVFEVRQAAAAEQPTPDKLTLDITVAPGDELGEHPETMLTFTVKSPLAKAFDFCCVAKRDVDNLLSAGMSENDIIEMDHIALDAEYVAQMTQPEGFALQVGPLSSDTEYSLLGRVTGTDGEVLIARCDGRTEAGKKPGENLNAPFKVVVDPQTVPGGFLMTITPDDLSTPYVCHIALKGNIDRMATDEELVALYLERLGGDLSPITFTGEISTSAEQFKGMGSYLPGAEYYVVAFGFDGQKATTPVLRKLVKAGEGPSTEGFEMQVEITDISDYSARATIRTNRDYVPFVYDILDRYTYEGMVEELKAGGMTEGEIIRTYFEDLFEFQKANYQASPAEVIETFGGWYSGAGYYFNGDLYPETEFVVFAAACDAEGNISDVYTISDPFMTLPEGGVAQGSPRQERPLLLGKRPAYDYKKAMRR